MRSSEKGSGRLLVAGDVGVVMQSRRPAAMVTEIGSRGGEVVQPFRPVHPGGCRGVPALQELALHHGDVVVHFLGDDGEVPVGRRPLTRKISDPTVFS